MTSKLTRLTDDELTETLRLATSGYPLPACVEGNLRHAFAELQERRKADSEPVAWTDEEELRDVNVAGIGYLFGIDQEANKFADPRRQIMLYRHAQPAPVVPNGLRLALSNAGIAAPESDEMLAATCEKHIQALVTWVKDRKPFQSAPVVPSFEEWLSAANRKPLGWVKDAMREAYDACRAAMLQHQPQNAQQNIPENIPGGLVEAVNNLLNNDGSRGCYDAMECGTAREKIELWLAQRQRWEEQRKANLSAGNSPVIPDGKSVTASTGIPVIPDGYVIVPKEPTQAMCAAFNDSDYGRKSLRERYVAMLAAAPQEVK